MKCVSFRGSSLNDLKAFPDTIKKNMGYQLQKVQYGQEPDNYKIMTSVGVGVKEIREKDKDGIYRTIYVAKFKNSIYVLHCFQKKTQKTEKKDIDLAKQRYNELKLEVNNNE